MVLVIGSVATVQADTVEHAYQAPKISFMRFHEDWSGLKGVDRQDLKPTERLDYIRLSKDGENWVSFGGLLRARTETYDSFAFGTPANADDSFLVYRALFHADWHFGDGLRVFSERKHADISGRDLPGGTRPIDEDEAEIQQFFIDYIFATSADSSFTLRIGRQEYEFGKSRLISPLPRANALRHWDGITGIYTTPQIEVNLFYASFNPVDQDDFNNDPGNRLAGICAKQKLSAGSGIEYYCLANEREHVASDGTLGDEEWDTFGIRHWGRISDRLSYELEGAYQTGDVDVDVDAEDVTAYMFAADFAR